MEITPAEAPGTGRTVAQTDNTGFVARDRVAVDPAAGTVTARSDFADWPLLAQLSSLGIQAHMGVLFGPVNQILLAALALGLLCVIVWGYRMWWQRRPTRADRRFPVGAPPARGGVRGCRGGRCCSACRSPWPTGALPGRSIAPNRSAQKLLGVTPRSTAHWLADIGLE